MLATRVAALVLLGSASLAALVGALLSGSIPRPTSAPVLALAILAFMSGLVGMLSRGATRRPR